MAGEEGEKGEEIALIGFEAEGRGTPFGFEPAAPGIDRPGEIAGKRGGGVQALSPSHCRRQCSITRARKLSSSVPWPGLK